jgi:hypothetical protein
MASGRYRSRFRNSTQESPDYCIFPDEPKVWYRPLIPRIENFKAEESRFAHTYL